MIYHICGVSGHRIFAAVAGSAYSDPIALIGSTIQAFLAGTAHATTVTVRNKSATAINVSGSRGPMPKVRLRIR